MIFEMSTIDTEKLISEVRKYEILYNQELQGYKDYRKKDKIFENEISKAIGGEKGKLGMFRGAI